MADSPSVPERATELAAGMVIADRYELREVIGVGGMASVWRAVAPGGQEVALKFVGPLLVDDRQWRKRFEREARLLVRIGQLSEHVVRILDHGVAPGGGPFLAMELLAGESLASRLHAVQRMRPSDVVPIVGQLCKALTTAHGAGVIHRDIKPANVFLHRPRPEAHEVVKLLDFGIAKVQVDSDLTAPTREGTMLGTPQYMSPEQFLGDTTLDARADLWSVGVVVYRMLVGQLPFSSGPMAELAARILAQPPPAPSSLVPSLPRELDAWVEKALAKRPEARFQDAEALAVALADALPASAVSPSPTVRRAKGVNLVDLVKLLCVARREGRLGGLSPDDARLLDERILVSSWYPIETFWRLLELAYEHVLGSSDERAIQLGRAGAERAVARIHAAYVRTNDLGRGLRAFERGWGSYFDFGSAHATLDRDVVRIAIRGYPDIPRTHGLTTQGWFEVGLTLLGWKTTAVRIVRQPWSGDDELLYEFVGAPR